MRLTLRTLLAWLDDTLNPGEVREIGSQVAESPFAQELSERIQRVTRQRRLAVPSRSGPDGTDPNTVAAYLDNDLEPEDVAEYEKKCLSSDVNLAEAASVHQILSLLGQKVKVPAEARARMYQLVKGRESNAGAAANHKPIVPLVAEVDHTTQVVDSWVAPDGPPRRWTERYGSAVACAILFLIAGFSAWRSLRPLAPPPHVMEPEVLKSLAPFEPPLTAANTNANAGVDAASPPGMDDDDGMAPETKTVMVAENTPAAAPDAAMPPAASSTSTKPAAADGGEPATVASKSADRPAMPVKEKEAARAEPGVTVDAASSTLDTPKGTSGLAAPETSDSVVLRYDNDAREWVRIMGPTPLGRGERVLSVPPSRAFVTLGTVRLVLVGDTEVRVLSLPTAKVPSFELVHGRVVLRKPPSGSLEVAYAARSVKLDLSPEDTLIMARTETFAGGQTAPRIPALEVVAITGEPSLTGPDKKVMSLAPLRLVAFDASGKMTTVNLEAAPPWATDPDVPAEVAALRAKFAKMFHPGRPVLAEVVAASEDDDADVKNLAISAISALGDLSLLMPVLARKDDQIARRSAIAATRMCLTRGPEAMKKVKDQLVEEFGDEIGARLLRLVIGYSPEEAKNSELYGRLVDWLGPEQTSVGVRELALDNLLRLTGRDSLGYDPDHPEGKGLDAWKELKTQGKLHPPKAGPQP